LNAATSDWQETHESVRWSRVFEQRLFGKRPHASSEVLFPANIEGQIVMAADHKIERGRSPVRQNLQNGQIARLMIVDADSAAAHLVVEVERLIEAPNWTPDGRWLVVNGGGRLYRIAVDGPGSLEEISTGSVGDCNNDHVLSPDGNVIYISAGGHLYAVPFVGGEPKRISNVHESERHFKYFLHGVSPDNMTLAYVAVEARDGNPWGRLNIAIIPSAGGLDRYLTDSSVPVDGPEFSPDGCWIYYNSEQASSIPGHAQIFRMRLDGTGAEQLTFDDRVNWFPHVSPNGERLVYLSYPPGTKGHPANLDVILRTMSSDGGPARDIARMNGGQGTINVNSWAPDSRRFAYVDYARSPLAESSR
jgi:TolB protein